MTKVMSHIIGVCKKADSQKEVRKAKSLGTSGLVDRSHPYFLKEILVKVVRPIFSRCLIACCIVYKS